MVDIETMTVIKKYVEEMTIDELKDLKANLDKEFERRERLEYDKLLENFTKAFYELYSKFPHKYCFTDGETWEDLYENHNWDF